MPITETILDILKNGIMGGLILYAGYLAWCAL